jgi:exodeoxyribonuclease VII large subunit
MALRLRHAVAARPREARLALGELSARLDRMAPSRVTASGQERLRSLSRRLVLASLQQLGRRQERASVLAARLEAASPEQALVRGYSITLDADGKPVRDATSVAPGSLLVTRLQRGELRSRTEPSR